MIYDAPARPSPPAQESPFINIEGIDAETGLALYNGDEAIYLAVLRSFVPNAQKVLEKTRALSRETLSGYTTQVHGLKSICAGIGAEQIRAAAAKLEQSAKAGDFSAVEAGNSALLLDTEKLAERIEDWLLELDSRNPRPRLERPDPALLARLRKSCENYDMNGIDDAMDELENNDYGKEASLVAWLREKTKALDFSSAASRLLAYEKEST